MINREARKSPPVSFDQFVDQILGLLCGNLTICYCCLEYGDSRSSSDPRRFCNALCVAVVEEYTGANLFRKDDACCLSKMTLVWGAAAKTSPDVLDSLDTGHWLGLAEPIDGDSVAESRLFPHSAR